MQVEAVVVPTLDAVHAASASLDEWVREIVAWHFDARTGSRHWIERARTEGWDPIDEIGGYDDLVRFGNFDEDLLRTTPPRDWVPAGCDGRTFSVYETGGTTGLPKLRLAADDVSDDYERFSATLPEAGFPLGADWLSMGPSGPHRTGEGIRHLARHRGGDCYRIDVDPRWYTRLAREGRADLADEYERHLVDQALAVLTRPHASTWCLHASPKLLVALGTRVPLSTLGIAGVFCSGTSISPQLHRLIVEEVLDGAAFAPTYGNTLMGLAAHQPSAAGGTWDITYHAPQPRAVLEVVDPADPGRRVGYGETGRVLLTTLTRELFLPRLLERDEAVRAEPGQTYPWDGVRNVRPAPTGAETTVEGVY